MFKIEWKSCFKIGLSAVIVYLFIFYFESLQVFFLKAIGAAVPLLVGCIIAYVINIIMNFYEGHFFPYTKKKHLVKIRRPVCLLLAAISLIGIIALIISLVLPQLTQCVNLIIEQAPVAIKSVAESLNDMGIVSETVVNELSKIDLNSRIGEIAGMVTSYFGNMVNIVFEVVTSVFSVLVSTFIGIIFAFYVLLSKDRISVQINKIIDTYASNTVGKKIRYVSHVFDDSFHKYIVGQTTEAVILGALCTMGMLILRLPYATMIGALVAFTALVPIVGAYVGAVVGAFMIFMVNPMDALVFLIFLIILQQIEGNIIYPKVVGASLGLPGIWVLAAITIGGGVLGVAGMLLGVPLMAAIYRIVRHDVKKRTRLEQESVPQKNAAQTQQEPQKS